MVTDLLPGTGAAVFALHAGATPGVVTQRRVLHLDKVPADKITELSETARRAAPGYSLSHWAGRTAGFGSLTFSVAAFHNATGEMAVLTQVELDPETPEWAQQQTTAVAGRHRGYRLGLQVKAVMAWWLKQVEPRLRHIVTWGAGTDQHIVAINTLLGYDPFEPSSQMYELTIEPALRPR